MLSKAVFIFSLSTAMAGILMPYDFFKTTSLSCIRSSASLSASSNNSFTASFSKLSSENLVDDNKSEISWLMRWLFLLIMSNKKLASSFSSANSVFNCSAAKLMLVRGFLIS